MIVKEEKCNSADIVLVLEATANMVAHWDSMKKLYLVPSLMQFHKQSKSNNHFPNCGKGNRYSLILFHAADRSPDSLTQCLPPTERIHDFLQKLDSISFTGGGREQCSHVTEGLATALQLFHDLAESRVDSNVDRFCFLICNTPPYQIECIESYEYGGCSGQEICSKLHELSVKMSIFCPRHMSELQQIYQQVNNLNQQKSLLNYTLEKRHLVLVEGYKFPSTQEPILVAEKGADIKPSEIAMDVTIPSVPVTTVASVNVPISAAESNKPSTMVPNVPTGQVSIPDIKPVVSSQQQQQPVTQIQTTPSSLPYKPSTNIVDEKKPVLIPRATNNSVFYSQNSMANNPTSSSSMIQSTAQASTQKMNLIQTSPSLNRPPVMQSQPGQQSGVSQQPMTSNQSTMPNASNTSGENQQAAKVALDFMRYTEKQVNPPPPPNPPSTDLLNLWSGNLEWHEKRRGADGNIQKILHTIPCQIYQAQNKMPVNTKIWPPKLSMQIIPQLYIQPPSVYNHLRSSKYVLFHFQQQNPTYQLLIASLQKDSCGFINVTPEHNSSEKKLIIIILKKKDDRNSIVGLIPDDAETVLNGIRLVAQKNSAQKPTNVKIGANIRPTGSIATSSSVPNIGNPSMYRQTNSQQFDQGFRQTQVQPMQVGNMATGQRMAPQANPRMININTSTQPQRFTQNIGMQGGSNTMQGSGMQSSTGMMNRMPGNMSQQGHQMRMPQMHSVQGIVPNMHQPQLRNLLRSNTNVQQVGGMNIRGQDSNAMRQAGPGQMQQQQQNFVPRNMHPIPRPY